jgi:HlyD family secretion protein
MPTSSRRSVGFCALVFLAAGCQRSDSGPPAAAGSSGPNGSVAVAVATPKRQTLSWVVEQPGSVQPFEVAPIEARVSGYVKTVNVDIGDEVKGPAGGRPGTVLADLDTPDLVQDLERKTAAVELAKADAEQARRAVEVADAQAKVAAAQVREAEAGVAKAKADVDRWESELGRMEKLVSGGGLVDRQQRDETRRQVDAARAARQGAEAKVESEKAGVAEAEAKKRAAQAALAAATARVKVAEAVARRAAVELGFATLTAPFDGVVTARLVHPGHLIKTGSGPLFTVARLDVVRVFVDVPESAAAQAKKGAKVEVRVPSLGNRVYTGEGVTRTAGVLNPDARTLKTEIDLQNPDGALKPGTYVTVRLSATTPDALVVPAAAVLFADETAYCYAVEDGKAVKLQVRTGRSDGGGVQLLAKRRAGVADAAWQPVTGSETVVVGNLGALSDGQPVTVKE